MKENRGPIRPSTPSRFSRSDALRRALVIAAALLAPVDAIAQSSPIDTTLRVEDAGGAIVRVVAVVRNTTQQEIGGLRLVLWPGHEVPIEIPHSLQAGMEIQRSWSIDRNDWSSTHARVAAVRTEFKDATGRVVSRVRAEGGRGDVGVSRPVWPHTLGFSLRRASDAAARSYRISWWTPWELAVLGEDEWRAGDAEFRADVSPTSLIDGTETALFAILLPDDGSQAAVVEIPVDARTTRPLWQPHVLTMAIWSALVLLAAAFVIGRTRVTALDAAPAVVLILIGGAIALTLVPPSLLTLRTTAGGGDYASHFVASEYLRRSLLPDARTFGWFPSHFAGHPLFLMYFPLGFWISVAGALVAFPPVAFKAATFIGPLLLPFAWFVTIRWLRGPAAAQWIGAAAAIVFLLNEPQQVWGGNLPSVLAGEFAQALGFPLSWMAIGWMWAHRDAPHGATRSGLLLALSALAHAYAGVAAAIGAVLPLFDPRRWWPRLVTTTYAGAIAAGVLAWWLAPMFWTLPWTTASREIWTVDWHVLFPATTWPLLGAAMVSAVRLAVQALRHRRIEHPELLLLLIYAAVMWGVAQLAHSLGLVNIRFLPMFLASLMLAGAWEAGWWIDRLRPGFRAAAVSLTIVALAASAVFSVRYLPFWMRWNLHGLEHAPGWRDYSALAHRLKNGSPGRVFYEHSIDHDRFGTPRAFELLPLFAGRSTLEGLYLQSALLAPSILYLQSELSAGPSCAVSAFECGRLDPRTGVTHARMLGADTIVGYSRSVTEVLDHLPEVAVEYRNGHYAIYRIRGAALAVAVSFAPVYLAKDDWRYQAHDWWRAAVDLEVPLIVSDRTEAIASYVPGSLPRRALEQRPVIDVALDGDAIVLRTDRPRHPVLVRVAYHPGWRSDDGSPVELAAPGIMLVTPIDGEVRLRWSSGTIGGAGVVISVAAILFVATPRARTLPIRLGRAWRQDSWRRAGIPFVVLALAVMGAAAVAIWRAHPPIDANGLLAEGQSAMGRNEFDSAERIFARVRRGQRPMRDDADFYLGLTASLAGRNDVALQRWETFLQNHPVSSYTSEVLVRLARMARDRGERDHAHARFMQAATAPVSPEVWREVARAELFAMRASAKTP